MPHEIILAYINAIFKWPLVVGLLGGAFLGLFHQELSDFIRRLASIKAFGGEVVAIQQQLTASTVNATVESDDLLTVSTQDHSADNQIAQALQSEQAAALTWEFRYLNYFLATTTQHVLNWMVTQANGVTENHFNARWSAILITADNQNAIVNALRLHGLVELTTGDSPLMSATEKGRAYSQWAGRFAMGYVPVTPAPMSLALTSGDLHQN